MCATLADQGCRLRDFSSQLGIIILRLTQYAITVLILFLLLKSFSPGTLAGDFAFLAIMMQDLFAVDLHLVLGPGRYIPPSESPLNAELTQVINRHNEESERYVPQGYRLEGRICQSGQLSRFGVYLIRTLRWELSREAHWNHIPIEFVRNLSPEVLSAAVT